MKITSKAASYRYNCSPFDFTQNLNLELSGRFDSNPFKALTIRDCFLNVIVLLFDWSPYVESTQGWYDCLQKRDKYFTDD